jgi:hypothetical protein
VSKRTFGFVGLILTLIISGVANATIRDGSRDFDFNVGTWKSKLVRVKQPLSGSRDTMTLEGTVRFSKIWDGNGLYEEIEADGPNGHWQGMTVFLYNPKSGQWSQRFSNGGSGHFERATFGGFKDGRGELYSHDTYKGRAILVRDAWSDVTPDSHTYEESYSDNGGKTWEVVITAKLTRTTAVSPPAFAPSANGAHDFDFDWGSWRTQTSRLVKPLTGSTQWVEMEGTTKVTPIWGGRANIAEFSSDGPNGHLELISLRLFDPTARQWSLNFATRDEAIWSVPMIGEFKNGRGAFYDQEDIGGRMILVRFTFLTLSPTEARSEQAFSDDGGKTWETNWINRYTRSPEKE